MSANRSQWPSTGLRIGSLRPGRCCVAVGTVLIVSVFLVGGGVDTIATFNLLDLFRAEVLSHASERQRTPRVAVALFDDSGSAQRFLPGYADALCGADSIQIVPVLVRHGQAVTEDWFIDVDGIAVAGGPTPEYLAGLVGAAHTIRVAVATGVPYVGFSAGAMIAPECALTGGFQSAGIDVCPREWSEGLDPITTGPGLGLVRFTVDVHTAQAGTLGRAIALVEAGESTSVVGLDEDTCLALAGPNALPEDGRLTGTGAAWIVRPAGDAPGCIVRRLST
jgi:cyanophycinase